MPNPLKQLAVQIMTEFSRNYSVLNRQKVRAMENGQKRKFLQVPAARRLSNLVERVTWSK